MMKDISLSLFNNQSLIQILFVSSIVLIINYLICNKFNIKKHIQILLSIIFVYTIIVFTNLGSLSMPTTYWQPEQPNEYVIFELPENTQINRIVGFSSIGDSNDNLNNEQIHLKDISLYGTNNLNSWNHILDFNDDGAGFMKWQEFKDLQHIYKYIKLQASTNSCVINELGIYDINTNDLVKLSVYEASNINSKFNPQNIIDEQSIIPETVTYMHESYFDEIYHVRNAIETKDRQLLSGHVHPLLGTHMISLGTIIFGENAFGFRFMGALASVLSLLLIYLLADKIFKNKNIALLSTGLFALDFMHLTTARIATLEPFSILSIIAMYYFLMRFIELDFINTSIKKLSIRLLVAGIFMGISWATKWTGMYASVGLAIIFFYHLFINYKLCKKKKLNISKYINKVLIICSLCLIFFILIPLIIYALSYMPVLLQRAEYTSIFEYIKKVYDTTMGIFNYHSKLVVEDVHPFASDWRMWLFDIKPIWYYVKDVENIRYSISCFNNPIISWVGIIGVLYTIYYATFKKDFNAMIISCGYLTSFVPNIIISRELYAYHYYPAYPFLILAICFMIYKLYNYNDVYKRLIKIFIVLAIILFILFLPVLCGFGTTNDYINGTLRWFESWWF